MPKKILVDMHTHLNEKKIKPIKWWNAVKEKNLSVVAITEHTEHNPELAYKKLLKLKPKNILLIPGMEANTTAGHLLVYGENENIYKIKELQTIGIPIEDALKIIKKNKLMASFAHPYGYETDSTCSIIGEKKSINLVKKYEIGSEYYNGMLGSANELIFGTKWVKKIYNFFDYTANNKIGKEAKITSNSNKIKNFIEKISEETFERVKKGIEFSKHSKYITVGSDAHYPRTIGTSILELTKKPKTNKEFLKMIIKGDIKWAGPNIYLDEPVDKVKTKEIFEGITYVTKTKLKEKILRRKKNEVRDKRKN